MKKDLMQMATYVGIGIAVMSSGLAQVASSETSPLSAQAEPEWTKDVTVLVIAPDGTWGATTASYFHVAFARAIADCKRKYHDKIGCGYQSTAIRSGWILAIRCGRENIIVAAKTPEAVTQAAINSEIRLRRDYQPAMPPCIQVVSVDPEGRITTSDVVHSPQAAVQQRR
jgi:hypothetical protein